MRPSDGKGSDRSSIAAVWAVEQSESHEKNPGRVANALRKESNCHASQVMDGRSRLDRRDLDPHRSGTVGPGIEPGPGEKTKERAEAIPETRPQPEAPKPPDSHFALIKLNLLIAGLGQKDVTSRSSRPMPAASSGPRPLSTSRPKAR